MDMVRIDREKCSACGLCSNVCGLDVITAGPDGAPVFDADALCNRCGHCVAVCPAGALSFESGESDSHGSEISLESEDAAVRAISAEAMEQFLSGKRSCRHFSARRVERDVLERLTAAARMAPSALNCQERTFIVVTDRHTISTLRWVLIRHIRSLFGLATMMVKGLPSLFLDRDAKWYFRTLRADLAVALRHVEAGDDYVFHDAPCLVFFTGIKNDPAGRDHALGAQHYFMLMAETMGLGTCINGYAQTAPKLLAKHLPVPRHYRIYGAIMLGYRKIRYRRPAEREPAQVAWC